MYGQDFDDARGLICGGDFSLPITTSAWTDYQVRNKTYQEQFDRQITHMEVGQQIAMEQAQFSSIMGGIGGLTGGAMAGAKIGGPYGAIAGAASGALTAGVSGFLKVNELERQQQEDISYAYNMYNYNLQNIQALPYSLTKVNAYTENNKLFPMVEYYTCKSEEVEALLNKIKYNGMTIMKIDRISNYILDEPGSYIKGQIIRINNLSDDTHMLNAIYEEINKGVYL